MHPMRHAQISLQTRMRFQNGEVVEGLDDVIVELPFETEGPRLHRLKIAEPVSSSPPATCCARMSASQLSVICADYVVPLKAAARQFPLRHAAVSTVLEGVYRANECRQNMDLMRLPLPGGLLASP